jgi:hypothetical protein
MGGGRGSLPDTFQEEVKRVQEGKRGIRGKGNGTFEGEKGSKKSVIVQASRITNA